MNTDAQRDRLSASLTDKELYRALYLYDQVEAVNLELLDLMTLIWPGDLLADMTPEDMKKMLKGELDKRTRAKGQGVV